MPSEESFRVFWLVVRMQTARGTVRPSLQSQISDALTSFTEKKHRVLPLPWNMPQGREWT
jgi:hypothetical protein